MENKQQFAELLTEVMAVYGKQADKGTMRVWWEILKDYSFEQISMAFSQHTRNDKFPPVPASIVELLPDNSGHLSPDEAWNALPKTEYEGGYVTQQIMEGMGACLDSIDRGDMIGARMAFIAAYKRSVTNANASGEKAKYFYTAPSIGSHEQKQQIKAAALLTAKDRKWITQQRFDDLNKLLDKPIHRDNPALSLLKQGENGLKKIASE